MQPPISPSDFDGLSDPRARWYPQFFFIKMTAKDVKEITPQITFFSVLERPGKKRKATTALVRRGLKKYILSKIISLYKQGPRGRIMKSARCLGYSVTNNSTCCCKETPSTTGCNHQIFYPHYTGISKVVVVFFSARTHAFHTRVCCVKRAH